MNINTYKKPSMIFVTFDIEDVITSSGLTVDPNSPNVDTSNPGYVGDIVKPKPAFNSSVMN